MKQTNYFDLVKIKSPAIRGAFFIVCAVVISSRGFAIEEKAYIQLAERVEELLLDKNRTRAAEVIKSEIDNKSSTVDRKKAIKLLANTAELFLTEQGQKSFELGESIFYSRKDDAMVSQAIDKYKEAATSEVGNALVFLSLARAELTIGHCQDAQGYLDKVLEANPFAEGLEPLTVRVHRCQKAMPEKDQKILQAKPIRLEFVDPLISFYLESEDHKSFLEVVEAAKKLDSQYPTTYYWECQEQAKVSKKIAGIKGCAQKFLALCKNMDSAKRKKYNFDPNLCQARQILELENLQKSIVEQQ